MDVGDKKKTDVLDLAHFCQHFAAKVRGSNELQAMVKAKGLSRVLDEMHSAGEC